MVPCMLSILAITANFVAATPWVPATHHSTHRVRSIGPAKKPFTTYHPPATFEGYGLNGIDHPLSKRGITNATTSDAAKSFLEDVLSLSSNGVGRISGNEFDGVSHEHFHQLINGIPVANAVANVALKYNKIVSFGSSFVKPRTVKSKTPTLSKERAIQKAEEAVGARHNSWPTSLEYFAKEDHHVILTHVVQVQKEATSEWYEVYVDANNEDIVNIIDFVAHASYRAVPFGYQNPTQGYALLTNPEITTASPDGWLKVGTTTMTTTSGNNAVCSPVANQTSPGVFDYVYNLAGAANQGNNPSAARVNVFYVVNGCHDLTYLYGFTESSYNFQSNNYNKGGAANDRVMISLLSTSGAGDNPSFATPPDGQSPALRVYVSSYQPSREAALENDLIKHEFGHGVSNRLTGGGTARCLQTTEAGGLGEGWSDTFAELSELKSAVVQDYTVASWLSSKPGGIRKYPYSTNMQTNPLTYASLAIMTEVHDIGEVWAVIWHEIVAVFLAQYGYASNWTDLTGLAGNLVAMHLFIDSLKLQPCNPTFITARNALIQADTNRYAGTNKCLLWKAFAKRGLGSGATSTKSNNADIPAECK